MLSAGSNIQPHTDVLSVAKGLGFESTKVIAMHVVIIIINIYKSLFFEVTRSATEVTPNKELFKILERMFQNS